MPHYNQKQNKNYYGLLLLLPSGPKMILHIFSCINMWFGSAVKSL